MEIISEKNVSLTEVRKILEDREKDTQTDEEGMFYEQKRALRNAQECAKLKLKDVEGMKKELTALDVRLNDEYIIKIIDLLPEDVDDARAILAKERFKYDEGEIKKILDVIAKYR